MTLHFRPKAPTVLVINSFEKKKIVSSPFLSDFDKFDDPNFNPFESKKAMSNSPTPGEDEIKPKPAAYTMDFDKFDDPNFNPFESKGPKMANSPPPPSEVRKEEKESAPANDEEEVLNVTFEAPKE